MCPLAPVSEQLGKRESDRRRAQRSGQRPGHSGRCRLREKTGLCWNAVVSHWRFLSLVRRLLPLSRLATRVAYIRLVAAELERSEDMIWGRPDWNC